MYSHVLCSVICSSISAQIFAVHVYIFIELTTYKERVNLAGMGISGIETQQRFLKKNIRLLLLCIGMYSNTLLKSKMLRKIFKKKVFTAFIVHNKDHQFLRIKKPWKLLTQQE